MDALTQLGAVVEAMRIPRGRPVMLHVRLKTLAATTGLGYAELTRDLLTVLGRVLQPATLLIPTFTYTFTKSGIFHRLLSRSETGRFSEEARRLGFWRTPNPIFSVLDTSGWSKERAVDHDTAFGPACLWELLDKEDAAILNVDIDPFVATQVHYIERLCNVPYRFEKLFHGVVYEDECRLRQMDYQYYVRHLDDPKDLDWIKIRGFCLREGLLSESTINGVRLSRIMAAEFREAICRGLNDDSDLLRSHLGHAV